MPLWAHMEQHSYSPIALSSLIGAPLPIYGRLIRHNSVTQGSLKIWKQFRTHFKCRQGLLMAPISANILLPPHLIDLAFQLLARKGVGSVKDLFRGGNFMSFQQLRTRFDIPQSNCTKFYQKTYFSISSDTTEQLDRGLLKSGPTAEGCCFWYMWGDKGGGNSLCGSH